MQGQIYECIWIFKCFPPNKGYYNMNIENLVNLCIQTFEKSLDI